jgi:hypothetical protein
MGHMKIGLITILITTTSVLFGQSKNDVIGKYKNSTFVFMYSYTLTLKDSSKYETLESSDLGSEKTIGTWTIRGQAVRLTPKKKIIMDTNKIRTEKSVENSKEEVVVIATKNILTLKRETDDLKLERAK